MCYCYMKQFTSTDLLNFNTSISRVGTMEMTIIPVSLTRALRLEGAFQVAPVVKNPPAMQDTWQEPWV